MRAIRYSWFEGKGETFPELIIASIAGAMDLSQTSVPEALRGPPDRVHRATYESRVVALAAARSVEERESGPVS
jgi:hypothetical protein